MRPFTVKWNRFIYCSVVITLFSSLLWLDFQPGETAEPRFSSPENYDIRADESARKNLGAAVDSIAAVQAKRIIKTSEQSEAELRESFPAIFIERSQVSRLPEVIDFRGDGLSVSSGSSNLASLLDLLRKNADLFGISNSQVETLEVTADYTNPSNNLSYVHLTQNIDGIPVFQGEIKAGFSADGAIVRIINNLSPAGSTDIPAFDRGIDVEAIIAASKYAGIDLRSSELEILRRGGLRSDFLDRKSGETISAEKVFFASDLNTFRPAWKILYWTENAAFYVVIDAVSEKLLWRKNITENQSLPATFNVYGNSASFVKTADSPAPCSPGCSDPNNCPQPPAISRESFTLIGNESPYSFNDLGWIPDTGLPVRTPANANITDGNNCEAGIDRDGMNGVDPLGHAVGDPFRVFSYNYNPAPGNPPPADDPLPPSPQPYPPTQYQQGVIAHGFYLVNRWHDEMYRLGFTEAAGNFQHFNFGRGGVEGDRISFEIQDSSGTNGANFSTPSDGGRGRMQMFLWTSPAPDRDGALDSSVVLHEITHGLSSRLHGNGTGLGTNMARGMSEGWSDFYANAMLSEPSDALCGTYPIGAYISHEIIPGFANHYYGIRRYPTARITCTGPNGLPFNPLTFAHLNVNNCGSIPAAFPRGPLGSTVCDQIHNAGELWSQALWEVRGFLIQQHGAVEGNRRALQYITDGMKLSPISPNMLQSRDAIISAAAATSPLDAGLVWRGFAARGMGFSASILSVSPANVIEAFDLPNVAIAAGFSVSDAPGNGDGYFEPGEPVAITVPLINNSGGTVTGVNLRISGGPSAFYGDIAAGQTVTRTISFTIPANAPCPGNFPIEFTITSSAGTVTAVRNIFLGVPAGGPTLTFSSSSAINLPRNQPAQTSGTGDPYPSNIVVSGVTGQRRIKIEFSGISHTYPGDLDFLLTGPGGQSFILLSDSGGSADAVNLTFTLADNAASQMPETNWINGTFLPYNSGANDPFDSPAPAGPYSNAAPAGSSTFGSVFGTAGSTMNGTWSLYAIDDSNSDSGMMQGWKISFESNEYVCAVCRACPGTRKRADFDGDGKSDVSVFRPSDGTWYINRSTSGFSAVRWGVSGDEPVNGDFDADGKSDFAVFRPASDPAVADFYILNSNGFTFTGSSWGLPGDIPAVSDFDGDGRDDIGVYRPANHTFYILRSTSGFMAFSNISSGTPQTGDFDGDGKADFATYSVNGWFLAPSNLNYSTVNFVRWGASGDIPVVEDYDGDARFDFAVYRPSNGTWYIRGSAGTNSIVQFGNASDIPSSADYDGDGKADIAVYRSGTWYLLRSSAGLRTEVFGLDGDRPIPAQR